MKVTWEVEDGYVGKSAPQHCEVPDDELEECETEEERQEFIEQCVQDDFQSKISWKITNQS